MGKNNNKFIFKYNQEDELYNYVELNSSNKVLSYFKVEDNKLIRYDKKTKTKAMIKFKSKIKLKQKFFSNVSFISVFSSEEDKCIQYDLVEKEQEITLVDNNISISDYGKFIVKKWKEKNGQINTDYKENKKSQIEFQTNTKLNLNSLMSSLRKNGGFY